MLITNLTKIHSNTHDIIYHYDSSMLHDKFIFEESTEFTHDKEVITRISLKHYNNTDAFLFTLYEGYLLSPIQILRVLSDAVNLYKDNSLNTFMELIHDLSISTMTSLSQTQEKNKLEIREWIIDSFVEALQQEN